MKTYPHNVEQARDKRRKHREIAESKYPMFSAEWFAEVVILELEEAATIGIPDCYKTAEEWDIEFGPSHLPWNAEECREVEKLIATHPKFEEIAQAIQNLHGLNIRPRVGLPPKA